MGSTIPDIDRRIDTAFGPVVLRRFPLRQRDPLQAWNAADLLLLEYAAGLSTPPHRTLLVNDEFGALSIPLGAECCVWTDSQVSNEAIAHNASGNQLAAAPRITPVTGSPGREFDLVLLRIPKQLSLLRYQLRLLAAELPPGSKIVCGGMDKHLPRACADIIEEYLGPTERHRGGHKARIFSSVVSGKHTGTEVPLQRFYCEQLGHDVESLPNVFSAAALDIGTRLLLAQLAAREAPGRAVDLCCGNGVIGLCAMAAQPELALDFIDESSLAVASARLNVERLFPERLQHCSFTQSDGFRQFQGPAPDWILCNPPFHQQHIVDTFTGERLLRQAARVLSPGGELWLVANRHLGYEKTLARAFASKTLLAENEKFRVWQAQA
ncbi:MAG: class I SAM-dependent methyltransferase [Halieaceae bacterium]